MKIVIIGSLVAVFSSIFKIQTPQLHTNYTSVEEIQTPSLKESMERGNLIYEEFCVRCHKADGLGYKKFYPPLAGSDWLTDKRAESISAVKFGLKGLITVNGIEYKKSMSNPGIENNEIADVMNYIMNSWENTQEKMVTEKEVSAIQKK